MAKKHANLYDKDFYAWAMENARLLRDGKLTLIDVENIAEEIESMGKSQKHQLNSRFRILLMHLLKWRFQQERRSNSWKYTIRNQRVEIADLLKENPSLRSMLEHEFASSYKKAVGLAADETGLPTKTFPKENPFTLKECLSLTFFPD